MNLTRQITLAVFFCNSERIACDSSIARRVWEITAVIDNVELSNRPRFYKTMRPMVVS